MNAMRSVAKSILPSTAMSLPILRGPLRGGRFYANPRVSVRKVLGIYESELNSWLNAAVARSDVVIDVGANDGYFTFGCAAAMLRLRKPIKVISFEPQAEHVRQLETGRTLSGFSEDEIRIVPKSVGASENENQVTLDNFFSEKASYRFPLLKIDVEGAEIDVLRGATKWLSSNTMLLVEVHREEYLADISKMLTDVVGPLDQVNQRPLPFIGGEHRDAANWWLVSQLA